MNNLATQEEDKAEQAVRQDAKKAFILNVVFIALLVALYFINRNDGFLDTLVTRLFE